MPDGIDYSDRPQVCPVCGNQVAHTLQTTYCLTSPDDEEIGCGWLQVFAGGVDMRDRRTDVQ